MFTGDYIPTCDEDIDEIVYDIGSLWNRQVFFAACDITRYWDLPKEIEEITSAQTAVYDFAFAVATQIDLMGDERFEHTVREFKNMSYGWFNSWKEDWTREANATINEWLLTQDMSTWRLDSP